MNRDFKFLNNEFKKDLDDLIKKHKIDTQFKTNDFLIVNYIIDCLVTLFMFSIDIFEDDGKDKDG